MKSYSFLIAALASVLSLSCTKENVLPTPELSSSAYEVTVKKYSNTPAFELTWDFAGGSSGGQRASHHLGGIGSCLLRRGAAGGGA